MKKTFLLAALVAAILATNCVSALTREQMQADIKGFELPQKSQPNESVVYVVRPSNLGWVVRFNVFLDDKEDASEMGYNRGGQFISFVVPSGRHTIRSKAENWAEIEVDVKPGIPTFIMQSAQMGIIMARNSLHLLDDVSGAYFVKNTSRGTIIKERK